MTPLELGLLAAAGFVAGAINAAAGGGSLITYPALLAVGLNPLAANVTNTVGLAPGYLGGVFGHRSRTPLPELSLARSVAASVAGAFVGVAVLLNTSERVFRWVVPVLVLVATVLILVQPWLLKAIRSKGYRGSSERAVLLCCFAGGVYGAYFGAAYGVVLLALFAVTSAATWPVANAVKTLLSLAINVIA
ncbi:MAG: sulfite exporter TauE/SafE family protein, partial [Actinomycetota bacterium]